MYAGQVHVCVCTLTHVVCIHVYIFDIILLLLKIIFLFVATFIKCTLLPSSTCVPSVHIYVYIYTVCMY